MNCNITYTDMKYDTKLTEKSTKLTNEGLKKSL